MKFMTFLPSLGTKGMPLSETRYRGLLVKRYKDDHFALPAFMSSAHHNADCGTTEVYCYSKS